MGGPARGLVAMTLWNFHRVTVWTGFHRVIRARRIRLILNLLTALIVAGYLRAGYNVWNARVASVDAALPRPGQPAPELRLPMLDGGEYDLAAETRPVWIEFWATTCSISRQDLPNLDRWAAEHPEVTVLAVTKETDQAVVADYIAANALTHLTVLLDTAGAVMARYGVPGTPSLVLVGPAGTVTYARSGGPLSLDVMEVIWLRGNLAR